MAGFRAQIPTGDAPDNTLNAHCVTDYCYVLPAGIQPMTAMGIWRVFGRTIWTRQLLSPRHLLLSWFEKLQEEATCGI
jgi:hypothetical protein